MYNDNNVVTKVVESYGNGFSYGFTYDEFGNVLTTSIAGNVISTNEYAANNGSLLRTIRADGMVLENRYDAYGRITENRWAALSPTAIGLRRKSDT